MQGEVNDRDLVVDAHVTWPQVSTGEKLPVVFIFNCFALGQQRCSWYFDYARHLASYGYVVIQFEDLERFAFLDGIFTEAAVDQLMQRYRSQGVPLDTKKIGFVGHSKGGADALWMLDQQPAKGVTSTAFTLDGIMTGQSLGYTDNIFPPKAKVAMTRATVTSLFNLWSFEWRMLHFANTGAPKRVVAALALNVAHFSFVAPGHMGTLRTALRWLLFFSPAGILWALARAAQGASAWEWVTLLVLSVATWAFILDTTRPWSGGGEGVYDISSGLMVAWMEGTFRQPQLLKQYFKGEVARWDDYRW